MKNCKHLGFSYVKDGYKDIHIICDLDGNIHKKEYCKKCDNYVPRTSKKKGGEG